MVNTHWRLNGLCWRRYTGSCSPGRPTGHPGGWRMTHEHYWFSWDHRKGGISEGTVKMGCPLNSTCMAREVCSSYLCTPGTTRRVKHIFVSVIQIHIHLFFILQSARHAEENENKNPSFVLRDNFIPCENSVNLGLKPFF